MALYKISNNKIQKIERTTFALQNLKERADLQNMLKAQIEIIAPEVLIVAEEFGEWEDSRRRIDLLGIDKSANLVVIELKRTEDGGHMELQSIRYAAMISTLTFEKLVPIYENYLNKNHQQETDAKVNLLEFLDWNEIDEDNFAQEIRILLISGDFKDELITSVMWLNNFDLNIECIRMHPYSNNGETFLDIQKIIPMPVAEDYQIRIREKKQKERQSRSHTRDFTKYNVFFAGLSRKALSKRWMMFHIISGILNAEKSVDKIVEILPLRKFKIYNTHLTAKQVREKLMAEDTGGVIPRTQRFFAEDGEIFHSDDKTYVLSNQWGIGTLDTVSELSKAFPDMNIKIEPA